MSTSVLGLALGWPKPVLLVEADPTGSSVLPGYLHRFQPGGFTSVMDLVQHHHRNGRMPNLLDAASIVPETNLKLISGVRTPQQSASLSQGFWGEALEQFRDLDSAGIDVLIDLGRLGLEHYPTRILHNADLVLLVVRSTLPAIASAHGWVGGLTPERGVGSAGLLVVGPGQPYRSGEISGTLKLPVVVSLPVDPATAEVFSAGAVPGRRFGQSPLSRSLGPAAGVIIQHLVEVRSRLEGGQL